MSDVSYYRIICVEEFYHRFPGKERRQMINPQLVKGQQEETNNTSTSKPHQIEDSAIKTTALFFSQELLPYFHITGEVDHIGPTEIVHLDVKKYYEDLNLVMKDGSWIHFEFQSTDKGIKDLKRFRSYEALTSQQYDVAIRTYVLYSGNISHPITEFTEGFNTYRVQPIIMKGYRVEQVFNNINYKLEHAIPLTKEDLVPLTLCPLMSGTLSQMDRIHQALQILHKSEKYIESSRKIEAVIYAMANKFLNETELNQIMEEIKMTKLGTLLYNDGKTDGIIQEAHDNALNFFLNGASFALVNNSIKSLTKEQLLEIQEEANSIKNQSLKQITQN